MNSSIRCLPLEVSWHSDFAVDQGFHHPTDHLIQRPRHVFAEFALKTALHIFSVRHSKERKLNNSRGNKQCLFVTNNAKVAEATVNTRK